MIQKEKKAYIFIYENKEDKQLKIELKNKQEYDRGIKNKKIQEQDIKYKKEIIIIKTEKDFVSKEKLEKELQEIKNKFNLTDEVIKGIIKEYEEIYEFGNENLINFLIKTIFKIKKIKMNNILIFTIPMGIMSFILMSGTISGFMFSKDKNELKLLKSIPFTGEEIFKLKRENAIKIKLIIYIIYLLISILIIEITKMNYLYYILGIIMSIILLYFNENFELYLDMKFPNLNWKEEIKLIKGSPKIFILNVFKFILYIVIPGIVYKFLVMKNIININQYVYLLSGIIVLLFLITEIFIKINKNKVLDKLEIIE